MNKPNKYTHTILWIIVLFVKSPLFLYSLSQYSDENMMDPYNLATCFGPTLMPIPDDHDPVACQTHVNEVIKTIIIHNEVIFPSHRELDGPVYEKCMAGGEEYWLVMSYYYAPWF